MTEVAIDERERANRTLTMVLYGLHALGPFSGGLFTVVALIINYVKRDDVRGTWLDSHFRWQLRTFWFSLLWFVLLFPPAAFLTVITFGLGLFIFWPIGLALSIWWIYRLVKGFLYVNDGKPMYAAVT